MSQSRRPSSRRYDPIASLQDALDAAEVQRRRMVRGGAALALAAVLVTGAGAAAMARGNPSSDAASASVSQQPVSVAVADVSTAATAQPAAPKPEAQPASKPKATAVPKVTAPSPAKVTPKKATPKPAASEPQKIRIAIGATGYSPSTVTASANRSLSLVVGKGEGCAAGFLIPELNVDKDNSTGSVTINLGKVPAGTYQFSCGMEMVTGTLVVK